jgi:F420-0:gamma-glutamyl ligase-like protein
VTKALGTSIIVATGGTYKMLNDRLTATIITSKPPRVMTETEVPAFIIEELDDGRFTVFVRSVPTPLAGAVYVFPRERVHIVEVPFTQAIRSISRWGSGSKDLVAAMRREAPALTDRPAGGRSTGEIASMTGHKGA